MLNKFKDPVFPTKYVMYKFICICSMSGIVRSVDAESIANDMYDLHPELVWQTVIDVDIGEFATSAFLTFGK